MAEAVGEHDGARLHLRVGGRERRVSVPVPLGPRTLLDLLPAARAIAEGLSTLAAAKLLGLERGHVPLALALEWSRAHGPRLAATFDGATLFRTLLAAIDQAWSRPFEERQPMGTDRKSR